MTMKKDLSLYVPAKLTGDPDEMTRRYRSARVCGNPGPLIDGTRRKTAQYYMLLVLAAILAALALVVQLSSSKEISVIERDALGGKPNFIEAEVEADYEDESFTKDVSVVVLPQEPTVTEAAAALDSLKERLPKLILGENVSVDDVTHDLELVDVDPETGAEVLWSSDNEDVVAENGRVNLIEGKPGDRITLTARIRLEEALGETVIRVVLGTPGADRGYARDLADSVEGVVKSLSTDGKGSAVTLPDETDTGVKLIWSKPSDLSAAIALVALPMLGLLIYRNRYRAIDKAVEEVRVSIKRDFPDFLAKLLLLLNAGLVVTAAVAKIADDYRERRRSDEEKAFYEELIGMEARIRGANTSLASEFSDLAVRSGQREVMRFSAILADNIDKGSALADKLTQEEGMLRTMRRKRAEEQGRLAETKLTFPMALQLGAIIIITVAPATFEMG
jgi:hypothetical protein